MLTPSCISEHSNSIVGSVKPDFEASNNCIKIVSGIKSIKLLLIQF